MGSGTRDYLSYDLLLIYITLFFVFSAHLQSQAIHLNHHARHDQIWCAVIYAIVVDDTNKYGNAGDFSGFFCSCLHMVNDT